MLHAARLGAGFWLSEIAMKAFALAVLAALVLAGAAAAALNSAQVLAYQAYATSSTRVSEPGHNLVGPRWTGDPTVPKS
jgi:hypothetical protein